VKIWVWGDPDPRVVWGNKNLRWGEPGYLLEPGDPGYVELQPGEPGYVPPAPAPKPAKKPFHRKAKPKSDNQTTTPTTNTTSAMSSFQYNVTPKAGGGFSTRPVLGPEFEDATIDNAVSVQTGVTADKCVAVLTAYIDQFLARAAGCEWSHDFHGVLGVRPTSGGASPLPDGFHTPVDIKAGVSISINPTRLDDWQASLSIQSMGQVGLITPHVESIINLHDDSQDTYTGGEIMQAGGDRLDFDKTDPLLGVFYATAAAPGVKVRINSYGPISPTQINIIMPTGVTGPITLTVVTRVSGSLRSMTYTRTIEST
jgi:hypothetical protein